MKRWKTSDGPIDEADLEAVKVAITSGSTTAAAIMHAMNWKPHHVRLCDKALQLLKKFGEIEFDRTTRRWKVVEGGPL